MDGQRQPTRWLVLLPTFFTMLNVLCGFVALVLILRWRDSDSNAAAVMILLGMLFDGLDGRTARWTRTQSAFGVQIDSLADVVSFGVVPALLVYRWTSPVHPVAAIAASFLYLALGAARLARFNVLAAESKSSSPGGAVVGLPIPGAAGIIVSFFVVDHSLQDRLSPQVWSTPLLAVTACIAVLMISTMRFRSLKNLRLNARTVGFGVAAVAAIAALLAVGVKAGMLFAWGFVAYVAFGVFEAIRLFASKSGHDTVPPREP